jgi:hypothetical protein
LSDFDFSSEDSSSS